jgi:hypothetical protein
MMVLDKFQMGQEGCEIIPSREGFGVNHQAIQFALFADIGINFLD